MIPRAYRLLLAVALLALEPGIPFAQGAPPVPLRAGHAPTAEARRDARARSAESLLAGRGPRCDADDGGLVLPPGFCALVVADGLPAPRHLVVLPNGDIFAASSTEGVLALRDTTGDGRIDVRQSFGRFRSSEVAVGGGYLYADANGTAIVRLPLRSGSLAPAGPVEEVVTGLPGGGHSAKTFALAADGTLYVNIGSRTNSCQERDRARESRGIDPCIERDARAGVWAFRSDRLGQTPADGVRFGAGIRNAVGITLEPTSGKLYVTQHGRDQLADNWPRLFTVEKSAETPAEELFQVNRGDDFGWPYCYFDAQRGARVLAPEYGGDGRAIGRCAAFKANVAAYPGHWAPNALVFYAASAFPSRYRGGAFIAFHGSWNRAPLPQDGFAVVFQPMRGGRAAGAYEIFADGFMPLARRTSTRARGAHRPTGLAVGPDGSLYVSDDQGGRLWRILYTGER